MSSVDSLVVTYNCGRELLNPAVFSSHLVHTLPDASPLILVFALQEIAPIAYSFLGGSFLKPYLDRVHVTVDLASQRWNSGHEYRHVTSKNVGMTAIVVFVRHDFRDRIRGVEVGGVGVGWYEMGNKGGVAVSLQIEANSDAGHKTATTTFVAAHLAPMEWNLERRNEDWRNIVQGLVLTPLNARDARSSTSKSTSKNVAASSEEQPLLGEGTDHADDRDNQESTFRSKGIYAPGRHAVVAGDLNYRTSITAPRPSSRAMYPHMLADDDSPQHHKNLLPADQLSQEIGAKRTLHGFSEAPITFGPTYKYSHSAQQAAALLESDGDLKPTARRDGASANLDTDARDPVAPLDFPWSSHRWPSWCDRILFLSCNGGENGGIKPRKYASLPLMSTSDHQPVLLQFDIPWSSGPDNGPILEPPYEIDPHWKQRRASARRLEILTGISAYLTKTWEGAALVLAVVVGGLGGWAAISQLISQD